MLRALPILVLIAAAIDTHFVRARLGHCVLGPELYAQALVVWGVLGALALLPALPTRWLLRRLCRTPAGERPWGIDAWALGTWIAFPVLAHQLLDRYTSVGKNVEALLSARPWIEVGGLALALALGGALLARRLSALPGGLCAAVCAFVAAGFGLFGARTPEPLEPGRSAPEGAPNLLLLVWDTTRAQSLSPYGYERETTPHLARLAEESLLFEEARSVSCFTLSSHLSMLTGTYPSKHGARLTRMTYDRRKTPSLARLLHEQGYRTGGFVGTNVLRADTGMADGFEVYDDRVDPAVCATSAWKLVHDVQALLGERVAFLRRNGNPHWIEDFFRPAPEVLAAARAWIEREDARPWFCFVNLYDVHHPYLPEREARAQWVRPYEGEVDGYLFRSDHYHRPPGVREGSRLGAADDRHLMDLYDAELWQLDREVHDFLESIELARSHTALLLTADHGEAFGERETYEHNDILEPQVRVPFLLRLPSSREDLAAAPGAAPGVARSGRRVGKVSGVDVARTLAGLAGLEGPAVEAMSGLDLSRQEVPPERVVLVEDRDKLRLAGTHYAIYEGDWKLVRTGVGESATTELFDLRTDPVGERDLGAEQPELERRLDARLDSEREPWGGQAERWEASEGVHDRGLKGLGYTGESEEAGESKP